MSAEHTEGIEGIGIPKNVKANELSDVFNEIERQDREKLARASGGVAIKHNVDIGPVAYRDDGVRWASRRDIAGSHQERGQF